MKIRVFGRKWHQKALEASSAVRLCVSTKGWKGIDPIRVLHSGSVVMRFFPIIPGWLAVAFYPDGGK